ncbi:hypothetical protein Pla175_38410 [Pirellulimonas nuda]|uniref:Methane oxygenase PmoA n=1 Tax=Pirellulimonas nuda TaxID=2528009 RepID=A0A518DG28_9BACT|nr:DUF6807 family protein [Pirellulimonas nuda]QDU90437.1 hypothetical protein Pla175_38410 [Pirellulimonas nuda]
MRTAHETSRLLLVGAVAITCGGADYAGAQLSAEVRDGAIELRDGAEPVADYVYNDAEIPRPYFANLHGRGGVGVSRNHPPIEGEDEADHPSFHPGLWLAFGDLSGADNWRLQAKVVHARFLQAPTTRKAWIGFAVENLYLSADDPPQVICKERCRYELQPMPNGYLLTLDSTFYGDQAFSFGDQEEMGLGVRVATPLRVETKTAGLPAATGVILDSQGRRNAAEVWGKASKWVDYRGKVDGVSAGIAIFCHPQNFRPTRFHARDYGFIAANPFADAAFHIGPPRRTVVNPGASLRLRYGVLLHSREALSPDTLESRYEDYVQAAAP